MHQCEHLQTLEEETQCESSEAQFTPDSLPKPGDSLDCIDGSGGAGNWCPLDDLTRVRPIADRYSITHLNPNEWHIKNKEVIDTFERVSNKTDRNAFTSETTTEKMLVLGNQMQQESSTNISKRAAVINERKATLERAIAAIVDESTTLEEETLRLRRVLIVLGIPESIAKECITKRANRPESELVRDDTEKELLNELALISEIKIKLKNALSEFEEQRIENINARQRLEYDWSDKSEAYEIESGNCGLHNSSTSILFRPGVTRARTEQSTEQFWDVFTKKALNECELCRIKSINLRGTLSSIILNAARDLRTQADNIERALVNSITCTQETLTSLEKELEKCLKKLAENENCIQKMLKAIKSFDLPTKVAQTRLDNRGYRPHVEDCHDRSQIGLIDEVMTIEKGVASMLDVLRDSENIKNQLIQNRSQLEREIMLKRQWLGVDTERCMVLRSRYPSATALSGFVDI